MEPRLPNSETEKQGNTDFTVCFVWEDGGYAGVSYIKCKCGYEINYKFPFMVASGDIWECPKCGRKIEFHWEGMWWEELPWNYVDTGKTYYA